MGFVKRNIELEKYLDSCGLNWSQISDSQFKRIYLEINNFIDSGEHHQLKGDDAYMELKQKLPFDCYFISAPRTKHLFSIYGTGGSNAAFGYTINQVKDLDREMLNYIECVVVAKSCAFACMFNHEWQAHCPEIYVENNYA